MTYFEALIIRVKATIVARCGYCAISHRYYFLYCILFEVALVRGLDSDAPISSFGVNTLASYLAAYVYHEVCDISLNELLGKKVYNISLSNRVEINLNAAIALNKSAVFNLNLVEPNKLKQ